MVNSIVYLAETCSNIRYQMDLILNLLL